MKSKIKYDYNLGLLYLCAGSEDSLEETVTGNLNNFCVLPPSYSGPPRRGHLIFNAEFECGKLSNPIVTQVNNFKRGMLYFPFLY